MKYLHITIQEHSFIDNFLSTTKLYILKDIT